MESNQISAKAQQLVGNIEEAIDLYRKLLAKDPQYAPAHYEMGRIYLSKGWTDSALVHTKKAFQLQSNNVWYELQLAQIYEKQQDSKNHIATWEDIVKRNPDVTDYYYNLSNAYLVANNIPGSIEALDRAEKRFGLDEAVSLHKQKLWMSIDKPEKARKELEKLSDAVPTDPRYNAILAESYMGEKNYAKALQYYNRILSTYPEDENIHISLASCYMAMGDLNNTYTHLRKGVMNENIDCHHKLMYIKEFLSNKTFFADYSKRCFLLVDTLAQGCEETGNHTLLYGQMLAAQKRLDEASVQFAKFVEKDPSQYQAWEALLICEVNIDPTSPSLLEHAERTAELFPLHILPYLILTQGYEMNGDCEKAKQYLDKCLMIAPNDSRVIEIRKTVEEKCQ